MLSWRGAVAGGADAGDCCGEGCGRLRPATLARDAGSPVSPLTSRACCGQTSKKNDMAALNEQVLCWLSMLFCIPRRMT